MKPHPDDRPRISFDLPRDLLDDFNELLGGWRIKNALFSRVVEDLVKAMKKMPPKMRRLYIISIVDEGVDNYIKIIKEAADAVEGHEEVGDADASS